MRSTHVIAFFKRLLGLDASLLIGLVAARSYLPVVLAHPGIWIVVARIGARHVAVE